MPNEKVLAAKKSVVAELTEKMRNAQSGILVDYKGITVEADTKLRAELRKRGVKRLKVVYSREVPIPSPDGERIIGSVSFVPSVAGLLMAAEVIKDIANCK